MPTVQRVSLLAVCVLAGAHLAAQTAEPLIQPYSQTASNINVGRIYWHPVETGQMGLFAAVSELSQDLQRDQYLTDRGVIHSMNFQYGAFRYEKNYFQVYKGVLLRSFLDGKVDVGLFNHRPSRQMIGNMPANRYELLFRLNLQ